MKLVVQKVHDFLKEKNLELSMEKTQFIVFSKDAMSQLKEIETELIKKRLVVPFLSQVKVLGITIDYKLSFNAHIENIAVRTKKRLNILSYIKLYLSW